MPASTTVLDFPEAEVPPHLRVQVDALQDAEWPPAPGTDRHGHDPALHPVTVLLVADGRVLASLDVLRKEITHAGVVLAASGLSAVVTAPGLRGAGHGTTLVRAAHDLVARSGADLGVFSCDPDLVPFYRGCGWAELPGTSLIGGTPFEPLASADLGKVVVADFFTERARTTAPAFVGARVELYPGTVDRLW